MIICLTLQRLITEAVYNKFIMKYCMLIYMQIFEEICIPLLYAVNICKCYPHLSMTLQKFVFIIFAWKDVVLVIYLLSIAKTDYCRH